METAKDCGSMETAVWCQGPGTAGPGCWRTLRELPSLKGSSYTGPRAGTLRPRILTPRAKEL
jgi:hypothetical protein